MQQVLAVIILLIGLPSYLAQLPPPPDPGCQPTPTGLPSTSLSIFFESKLEDYVAAKVTCTQSSPVKETITCYQCNLKKINSSNIFFNVTNNETFSGTINNSGACCSGIRDQKGNIYNEITFYCSPGLVPGTLLLDPRYKVFDGASLKEEDYWSLITQSITPAHQSHTTYVKETYGVKENQAYLLSDSNGVRTTTSWNNNFGAYTNEMSSRLTEVYFHSIEIDMSVSITQEYSFNPLNTSQVDGIYELMQHYETILPKSAYDKLNYYNNSFKNQCKNGRGACYQLTYSNPYTYESKTYLQIVGIDNAPNC